MKVIKFASKKDLQDLKNLGKIIPRQYYPVYLNYGKSNIELHIHMLRSQLDRDEKDILYAPNGIEISSIKYCIVNGQKQNVKSILKDL